MKYTFIACISLLLIGCSLSENLDTEETVVEIHVDWQNFGSNGNKSVTSVSDSITHVGARLEYHEENAIFSQSVSRETAEEDGLITMKVPHSDSVTLMIAAVRHDPNNNKVFLYASLDDIVVKGGIHNRWSIEDFDLLEPHWIVADSLKAEYDSGIFRRNKDSHSFELWFKVNTPFYKFMDQHYDDLAVKLNGIGGEGEYSNGHRDYFVFAANPEPGTESEVTYKFFPYLNGGKFNLPSARYVVGGFGEFAVKWE